MRSFDSTTGHETWITPPRLQQSLGHFDLDPCAADVMPYKTADVMITKEQDGLKQDWTGKRVWLNPPYGRAIVPFLEKMCLALHYFLLVLIIAGFTILCVLALMASYLCAVALGFLDWMAPSKELQRLRRCSLGAARRMLYLLFG